MVRLEAGVVVLDLDDTLYLERDFARSGFAAAGAFIKRELGPGDFAAQCVKLLDAGFRGNIFDKALHECGQHASPGLIARLVKVYRTHQPQIALAPDAAEFLERISGLPTGIVSDGPEGTQQRKIDALGLERRIDRILLTGRWPEGYGKPHPRAFSEIMEWSGRPGADHVYIADNAAKDFVAPRKLGWQTVQILRPGRIHDGLAPSPEHEADFRIDSLCSIGIRQPTAPAL